MNTTEISLNFNKADLEEIYFKNRGTNMLFSKIVKKHFILSLILGAFTVTSLIYSTMSNKSWGIFTIVTVIFVLVLNQLIKKIAPELKWEKSIKDFLDEQAKFISRKLTLSENTLTLKLDTTITIMRWKDFKKVVIDDKAISLYGDETFVFPKKSMNWHDFDLLRNEILLRIKT